MARSMTAAAEDAGKLLLRLVLGVLILLHGVAKMAGGVGGISAMLQRVGMPGELAYLVYLGEVIAPLLVIVGLWTRLGALIIAANMVVAVALAHGEELFALTRSGGWALELQGMFFFAALTIVLIGPGRYAAQPR